MNEDEKRAIVRRAREVRRKLEGVEPAVLNPEHVPGCLRGMISEAEALGASEDPVRFELVCDLPYEYIADLVDRFNAVETEYHEWQTAATPESRPERTAFIRLTMAIGDWYTPERIEALRSGQSPVGQVVRAFRALDWS